MKKTLNHTHNLHFPSESFIRGGSGQEIRRPTRRLYTYEITSASSYPCRMGQNLANRIHLPYVTFAFTYQPYTVAWMNFTKCMALLTLRPKYNSRTIRTGTVSEEWRYVRYESFTSHANYLTYHPVPPGQNLLLWTLTNPKNSHSGIKVAESAIPHIIFF